MSEKMYFVRSGPGRSGPFSGPQIKKFAGSGKLKPTDHICQDGFNQWRELGQIPGLFSVVSQPPPLPQAFSRSQPPPLPGMRQPAHGDFLADLIDLRKITQSTTKPSQPTNAKQPTPTGASVFWDAGRIWDRIGGNNPRTVWRAVRIVAIGAVVLVGVLVARKAIYNANPLSSEEIERGNKLDNDLKEFYNRDEAAQRKTRGAEQHHQWEPDKADQSAVVGRARGFVKQWLVERRGVAADKATIIVDAVPPESLTDPVPESSMWKVHGRWIGTDNEGKPVDQGWTATIERTSGAFAERWDCVVEFGN